MDATITVRYFRVAKPIAAAASVETVLQTIFGRDLAARETDVSEGVIVRLERLTRDTNYVVGEFCRIQRENIPPSAGPDGLTPTVLGEGKGLGHLAAFRYHIPTKILLLQMNQQCVTPNRVSLYLGQSAGRPLYVLEPVLRADVLARLRKAEVKAFTVKFAEPQNMDALDDPRLSALEGVRRAAEILRAREIEITISAGKKKKREKIRPRMLQLPVRRVLSSLSGANEVSTLKAQIIEGDQQAKWIDLLEEQMKVSEKIDLPSDNPDRNYDLRNRFLTRVFNTNIAELNRIYGNRDDAD